MKKPSSITTCYGDRGCTRLYSGERVAKDVLRIEACGALDELVSVLGVARAFCRKRRLSGDLQCIQRVLFKVGAEVVIHRRYMNNKLATIVKSDVDELNRLCTYWDSKSTTRDFVLPGNTISAAFLDLARAVARRAERRLVTLRRRNLLTNDYVFQWINRLSDLLWLMARGIEGRCRLVKRRRSAR